MLESCYRACRVLYSHSLATLYRLLTSELPNSVQRRAISYGKMKGKLPHAKLQLLAPPPSLDRNLRMKRNENMGVDCSQGIEEIMRNKGFHLPVIVMNWNGQEGYGFGTVVIFKMISLCDRNGVKTFNCTCLTNGHFWLPGTPKVFNTKTWQPHK